MRVVTHFEEQVLSSFILSFLPNAPTLARNVPLKHLQSAINPSRTDIIKIKSFSVKTKNTMLDKISKHSITSEKNAVLTIIHDIYH